MTFSGSREDQVRELRSMADRVAQSHGLELFDLQFRRESIGWVLRIIIDRASQPSGNRLDESVSVSDCEVVSADVSAILDAEVEFEHTFTLEVLSFLILARSTPRSLRVAFVNARFTRPSFTTTPLPQSSRK